MLSLIPNAPRFLLDENVRVELDEFLESHGVNIKRLPKGTADTALAATSKREKRVLVTNDEDFSILAKAKVFGVVWLKIPQKELETLIASFQKLTSECRTYRGKLIVVDPTGWKDISSLEKAAKFRNTK